MRRIYWILSILVIVTAIQGQSKQKIISTDFDAIVERIESLENPDEEEIKDIWEKLDAVSGIISGVLVAIIGFYAANIFNRRQKQQEETRKDQRLSIQKADTLEKFVPHLTSDDPQKREYSLLIISLLLGDDIATELAGRLGGEGSASAIAQIAESTSEKSKVIVERALGNVFNPLKPAVIRITRRDGSFIANGFIYSDEGLVVTPAHVVNLLPTEFNLHTANGYTFSGKVVYSNKALDVAFIKSPEIEGITGVSKEDITPLIGSQVVSLWHTPQTGMRGETGSVLSTSYGTANGIQKAIGVTPMGSPGISGAPVISTSGKLIGLIYASIRGDDPKTLIIPAATIAFCLNEYKSEV